MITDSNLLLMTNGKMFNPDLDLCRDCQADIHCGMSFTDDSGIYRKVWVNGCRCGRCKP